jgi:hypothetical protein
MNKYMNIDLEEEKILNEKPYNGGKHFLFMLPEMFGFLIKVGLFFGLLYVMTMGITSQIVKDLPNFCNQIKNDTL